MQSKQEAILYADSLPTDLPTNHGYVSARWYTASDLLQAEAETLRIGDLIEHRMGGLLFQHWSIYIGKYDGKETVISFFGESMFGWKGQIRLDNLIDLSWMCRINNGCDQFWGHYPPNQIIQRAVNMMGSKDYDACNSNCEHFSNWCRYGKYTSRQAGRLRVIVCVSGMMIAVIGLVSGKPLVSGIGAIAVIFSIIR
uniref:LRAT domain-containing protein n=1 Tax=Ditylenchus dipsaci TaxID=166011 RepID=A0A915DTM2_9BILA